VKIAHGFHEEKVAGELKAVNDNNKKKSASRTLLLSQRTTKDSKKIAENLANKRASTNLSSGIASKQGRKAAVLRSTHKAKPVLRTEYI
jgi:hypothetical protein